MELWKPLNILSYGAGMPSTSLVGMACENARPGLSRLAHVPVYDAVIFATCARSLPGSMSRLTLPAGSAPRQEYPFTRWTQTCTGTSSPNLG